MLTLNESQIEIMFAHAREGYPNEVCGIMIGKYNGDTKETCQIRRAANLNTTRAHDRFELDPKDIIAAEKQCREDGAEIIGFYHSHPDHPDEPSEFDRERAWPMYSYVIASVTEGKEICFRSWVLNDETEQFEEEEVTRL